jgi:hypothetical protein
VRQCCPWWWRLLRGAWLMHLPKELSGTACDHAPIDLAPRLPLEPIAIAVQAGEEGEGKAHLDNGRGGTAGATDRLLRPIVRPGRPAVARLA